MWRYEFIQRLIDKYGYKKYLEIGLGKNCDNFKRIQVEAKIGVDPFKPVNIDGLINEKVNYYEMDSDTFLSEHTYALSDVDLIFIDGLHEYSQVYRECITVLQYLKKGGMILIHDCNPFTEEMAIPLSELPEYDRYREPWMGDVWKAIVLFRIFYPAWDVYVADTDCGIGIIKKTEDFTAVFEIPQNLQYKINNLQYTDLEKDRRAMLNLKTLEQMENQVI